MFTDICKIKENFGEVLEEGRCIMALGTFKRQSSLNQKI